MTLVTAGPATALDMGRIGFGDPPERTVTAATPSLYSVFGTWTSPGLSNFYGVGFTYDSESRLTGGVVTTWEAFVDDGSPTGRYVLIEDLSFSAARVAEWLSFGDDDPPVSFPSEVVSGDDSIVGGLFDDQLWGGPGNDTVVGGAGDDALSGGYSDLPNRDGANYLRGGDGNDHIRGGAEFDDINGNVGDDEAYGGPGNDWVLGGKGDDKLWGDSKVWSFEEQVLLDRGEGADILNGNLGDDTIDAGPGSDTLAGGQGADSLIGGVGDDWLSGDLGNDTLSGGAGADIFHSFGEAGVDRVTDFNRGDGDRVMLDPGGDYTVAQVGADTVITLGGGAQVILVGVQLSALGQGWIFEG